ncbi:probable acetolactate synthase large subunit, TPP family, partial [Streptomyces venezuelae ATCC 10712]
SRTGRGRGPIGGGQIQAEGLGLVTPDFELLARACGLPYLRITAEKHAAPVIGEAVASDGPTLVEVDLAALGPMKNPFTPPVRIPGR